MQHLPVHTQATDERLAGIGKIIEIEADEFEPAIQLIFFFQCGRGNSLEQIFAAIFLGPEKQHGRAPESIHREAHHLAVRSFEDAAEGCAKHLTAQFVPLERDHLKVGAEALLDHLLKVGDEPVVAEFERHRHGHAQDFRPDRRVKVAVNQRAQGFGACLGVGTLFCLLGLREKKIGFEAQAGEFVGCLDEFAAGFEEDFPIFRILVESEESLISPEEKLERQKTAVVFCVGRHQILSGADDSAHSNSLASFRSGCLGFVEFLVEFRDGFLGNGGRCILCAGFWNQQSEQGKAEEAQEK